MFCDIMISDIMKKAQFELHLKLDLYLTDAKRNHALGQTHELNFVEM
jgi:hypothetical protein